VVLVAAAVVVAAATQVAAVVVTQEITVVAGNSLKVKKRPVLYRALIFFAILCFC
jgi:hypothetical protein